MLAEALGRIARDQEGTAHIYKRLSYYGITLQTLSEGLVTELHVGLTGTMNQLFLRELASKTRRGLVARVKKGFSGGGRCFGHDIVDTGPEGGRGVLRINEAEAEVIRRILHDYAGGASPRAIARALNREDEPGPRGGEWSGSTISGGRRAGDGILHQELLVGVWVFNKGTSRKHPDTGRRSSILDPRELWIREAAPDLRIVDDALWAAVQARTGELSALPATRRSAPKRLLSRLMVCGVCGSTVALGGGKYACSRAREKGTCANTKIIAAPTVEARVLDDIRRHLLTPEAIELAIQSTLERRAEERLAAMRQRTSLERQLADVERRLARTQDLYVAGQIEMVEVRRRNARYRPSARRFAAGWRRPTRRRRLRRRWFRSRLSRRAITAWLADCTSRQRAPTPMTFEARCAS